MERKYEDIKGQKFGKLLAVEKVPKGWLCQCECGNTRVVGITELKRGIVVSCGCGKKVFQPGQRYGHLVTISQRFDTKTRVSRWLCQCDCGDIREYNVCNIRRGTTRSCGCSRAEVILKRNPNYGKSKTRLYGIWEGMRNRCENKHNHAYKHYGEKGIKVCREWSDFDAFKKWALENGYADNLSIDRIDVNGNYEPDNCRWSNRETQMNNMTTNRIIEYKGRKQTISQWADEVGIQSGTLNWRMSRGWDIEDALFRPVELHNVKKRANRQKN